jgi:ADP-ribose pyrophosphatase YjhB (NUDIX family)
MSDQGVSRWVVWSQELQALAREGILAARDEADLERWRAVLRVAADLLAAQAELDAEPRRVPDGEAYTMVEVRGAVFREGEILLVRERSDGRWTLPGGKADAWDTPSEAVEREIREESGYEARAVRLVAVYDRARQGHVPPHPLAIYKLFLVCELVGGEATHSDETDGVAFFSEDALPELSLGRVTPGQIARLFAHARHPEWPADFD